MQGGWIKLYRDITEHWIFQDAEYFKAWVWLIMMANHEDSVILFNKKPLNIQRGQYLTSRRKLADTWKWSRTKVSRFLSILQEQEMIKIEPENGPLITIENYCVYQDFETPKKATKQTTEQTTKQTTEWTTDLAQTIIYKNDKKGKKKTHSEALDELVQKMKMKEEESDGERNDDAGTVQ